MKRPAAALHVVRRTTWRCSTPAPRRSPWRLLLVLALGAAVRARRRRCCSCSRPAASRRSARSGSTWSPATPARSRSGTRSSSASAPTPRPPSAATRTGGRSASASPNILIWLPAAGLVAALAGVLVAPLATRLRGLYLAIVTLGLVFIGEHIFNEWDRPHRRRRRRPARRPMPELFGYPLDGDRRRSSPGTRSCIWLMLVLLVVFALAARNLARSKVGRAFTAIRDRDIAAGVIGREPGPLQDDRVRGLVVLRRLRGRAALHRSPASSSPARSACCCRCSTSRWC